jgi:hypothetical protein
VVENDSVTTPTEVIPASRADSACAAAVELAREAALAADADGVGEHVEVVADGDRVVTHFFEATLPGYRGWRWAVTVARAPRVKQVTVSELALLPGPDSVLAPEWLPWSDRLRPGDLGIGDLMSTDPDDDRLVPAYSTFGAEEAAELAELGDSLALGYELGIGRVRVMSQLGLVEAAGRWHESDAGPGSAIAKQAPAACGTCGFYLPLAGSMRLLFGACANLFAPDDGRVVSADHGCGAHSEVFVQPVTEMETGVVLDDSEIELVATTGRSEHAPGSVDDIEQVEPFGHG